MNSTRLDEWIRYRIAHEKNILLAIVGEPATGKSYAALRLGELFDKNGDFNAEHVAFDAAHFFDLLPTLQPGCFVAFDEAGVGYNSRNFMSTVNKMISTTIESFRFKYLHVIFTVPTLSMIDFVGRSMVNYVIRMLRPGLGIVYRTQPDRLHRQIFYFRVGKITFSLPSEQLCTSYEARKQEFLNNLYMSYKLQAHAQSEEVASNKFKSVVELAAEVLKKPDDFMVNGKFRKELIASKLEIGLTKALAVGNLATHMQKTTAPQAKA